MLGWIGRIALLLVALVAIALAVLYGWSEYELRRVRAVAERPVAIAQTPEAVAEGGRLGFTFGCRACHGREAHGQILVDDLMFGRLAAPGFARVARTMSDAELVRAIRQGVRKNGSTLLLMPSHVYVNMADDDVAKIVAWIRSLPESPNDVPEQMRLGPVARWLLLSGQFKPEAQRRVRAPERRPAFAGAYIVKAICAYCHDLHQPRLKQDTGEVAPALAPIGAAYDSLAFARLLRTGRGMSNRRLGSMREASRDGFFALTDAEIVAIQDYLKLEAARAPAQ